MSIQNFTNHLMSTPFCITATSSKSFSQSFEHMEKLYKLTLEFLKNSNGYTGNQMVDLNLSSWSIEVKDYTKALEAIPILLQHHNWLHERQTGVEIFLKPKSDDLEMQKHVLKIGAVPPTPNNMTDFYEIYLRQYLPDHSLSKTRWVHTLATIAGVSAAVYGIFSGSWLYVLGGIGFIYECGFHSHLFIERNIPSSTKYPLGSVYSDLRVTCQTLLNPVTGGMDRDLANAGIYDVAKKSLSHFN